MNCSIFLCQRNKDHGRMEISLNKRRLSVAPNCDSTGIKRPKVPAFIIKEKLGRKADVTGLCQNQSLITLAIN